MNYTYFADLAKEVEVPKKGILSRTLYNDDRVKVVLFGFAAGEELSEHTAATPAMISIIQGEADLTLGKDALEVGAGAWIHMPAQLPHSLKAKTPFAMLLLLMKSEE